jgi:predicted phage tail protein
MSVQGAAVPLLYGRLRVGSVVVSAGLYTEQIA